MLSSNSTEVIGQPVENTAQDSTGVEYHYHRASLWRGPVAAVLDTLLVFITTLVLMIVVAVSGALEDSGESAYGILAFLGSLFVYCWYFWTRKEGQTPGKRLVGIRVVRVDGQPITTQTAVVRFLGYIINMAIIPFSLGWLIALVNRERRGLHDYLAGTRVVMNQPVRVPARRLPHALAEMPGIESDSERAAQGTGSIVSQYQVAGLGRRLVAAVLDWFCIFLTSFVMGLILAPFNPEPGSGFVNLVVIGIYVVYFWYFWTQKDGQTPGKHAMGIRVVRMDGTPITTISALVRFGGYYLNTFLVLLGWLALLVDGKRRGWHDQLAGTMVVQSDPTPMEHTPEAVLAPGDAQPPVSSRLALLVVVAAGIAIGYVAYFGVPSLSHSPQTVTRGGVTVTVPSDWQTRTDFSGVEFCESSSVDCLFAVSPSSDFYFEVVRFEFGFLFAPTLEEFDDQLWGALREENPQRELVSREETLVDWHRAIQRTFTDHEKTYHIIVIEELGSILRFRAEGTPAAFDTYRDDLNTSIDSLQFVAGKYE